MNRKNPPDRFQRLVDAATRAFIDGGYERTQMSDVADAMKVAKGTLYLYVESKEALFDVAVRLSDSPRPLKPPSNLPLPTPPKGATTSHMATWLARSDVFPIMETLLARKKREDVRSELELLVRYLYDSLSRRRHGLKLVEASAKDLPELASVWLEKTRGDLIDLLTRYVDNRIDARRLRRVPNTRAAACSIVETTAFWAVHRHWDMNFRAIDESVAQETVMQFTVGALTKR
ncbi:MAG TPA: TetR family transcriptional regulator [Polyangiaceae bacterium]|nr:TetR family transcriptional regulator [Polyangiaceae bacterium]